MPFSEKAPRQSALRITVHSPVEPPPSSGWLSLLSRGGTSSASSEYHRLPTASGSTTPPVDSLFQGIRISRRRTIAIVLGALLLLGLAGAATKRKIAFGSKYARWGAEGLIENRVEMDQAVEDVGDASDMWGWTEEMGWKQGEEVGLRDLGEVAEGRYRLNVVPGRDSMEEYYRTLHAFIRSLPTALQPSLLSALSLHLPPKHPHSLPTAPRFPPKPASMISYKTIHQTDKRKPRRLSEESQAWADMNAPDGWTLSFLDDQGAQSWMEGLFKGSDVEWAWDFMHRGVLRADFLRYLLPLVEGGVYSDVDTRPLRPIEQWGLLHPEYLNLTSTDGTDWRSKLSTYPAVVVAVDVDVHAYPNWEEGWPRPLGICQWTLSSAPSHPIFLDAVRRVVNATRVVQAWEQNREKEIARLEVDQPEDWQLRMGELRGQTRAHAMSVMEWTGPGLFTDSVLAFLLARYNVTWHRLRGLNHPLRIGDVMILPITSFSPGGEPDFRAEGPDSPQANVLHNFRGSWKSAGLR